MELNKCIGCMENFQGYPCPHCGYDPGKEEIKEYALPPETILAGKYLVGRVLGQGGFGITYIGWDIALERKAAIKEYYPSGQVSRNPGTRLLTWYSSEESQNARQSGTEMFLKESRKMVKVDNIPGIVRVLDLFRENETAYIVMDFVEGQTLKARLKKTGPMSWKQAKEIFLPAIQTMEKVHQAGLIHRDLSPDNLMLTPDGRVRILDLGAAKDLNVNSGASSMQVAKGGFSPFEQYTQRGGSGPWTDVYAMAATIYYTLTGRIPPVATDRVDEDTISWNLPGLDTLPAPALEALQKAMTVSAKKRTQSMEELGQGLTAQEKPKPEPKPVAAPKPNSAAESKKKRWIIPVAAACVLVCLAVPLLRGGTAKNQKSDTASTVMPLSASNYNLNTDYQAQMADWTEHVSELPQVGTLRTYWDDQNQERCRIYEDLQGEPMFIITAEYDAQGNVIYQQSYDGRGELQATEEYTCSGDGDEVLSYKKMDGFGFCWEEMTGTLDSQNRVTQWVTKGRKGEIRSITTYEYAKDGACTATETDASGTIVCVDYYDADGKLISYAYYRPNGTVESRYECTYDDQGRRIGYKGFNASGEQDWESRSIYEGNLLVREEYCWDGERFNVTTNTYNSYGELLSSMKVSDDSANLNIEMRTIRGETLRSYSFDQGDSEDGTDSVTSYNWRGQLTLNTAYKKDGTLSSCWENIYDIEGERIKTISTQYYDDCYTVYVYDGENNPIDYHTYNPDGTTQSWEEYEYDEAQHTRTDSSYEEDGTLRRRKVHQYDDQNVELWCKSYDKDGQLTGEQIYHYDSNGVKMGTTSISYNSWNNTKTVREYDGDWNNLSEKTYDANGNLIP